MTFHEILLNLRAMPHSPSEIATALIETAANLKSGIANSEKSPAMKSVAESGNSTLLQVAARALLESPPEQRLSDLSSMLDSNAGRDFGEFWIRYDAARQLVGFINEAESVRFSYGCSIRSALLFALDCREKPQPTRIEYSGWGPENQFLEKMAIILELDIFVHDVRPWVRAGQSACEVEVIMPPFGADMSRTDDIPDSTLSYLGIFGGKHGRLSSESVAIADALQNAKGRVILVVSEGALFRAVGVESVAREELVHSGRLQAVMGLGPSMMFQNTSINSALLLLAEKGSRKDTIRFANLSDDHLTIRRERGRLEIRKEANWAELPALTLTGSETFAQDIDLPTIKAEGYTLTIDRYLDRHARDAIEQLLDKSEVAELADLVELIRPAALMHQEDGEYTILEAAPGDIGEDGYVAGPSREINVDRVLYRKAFNQQLRPGDVLISFKGTIGKIGLVPDDVPAEGASTIWAAGQSLMILRLKGRHRLSPYALCEYLSDEIVQEHLKSLAGGSAIQTIAMKDLKSFSIPLPDKETQNEIAAAVARRQAIHKQIEQLKAEIENERKSSWPHKELRSTQS